MMPLPRRTHHIHLNHHDALSDIEHAQSDGQISAEDARLQELLERDLEGPRTPHDEIADDLHASTKFKLTKPLDDELEVRLSDRPVSIEHQTLHLPYCKGCLGCDCAKMKRRYAIRRKKRLGEQVLQICGPMTASLTLAPWCTAIGWRSNAARQRMTRPLVVS